MSLICLYNAYIIHIYACIILKQNLNTRKKNLINKNDWKKEFRAVMVTRGKLLSFEGKQNFMGEKEFF